MPAQPTADLRGTLSHRQIMTVFSGLMIGTAVAALDGTIVHTALARIGGDLGGLQHIAWVVIAYVLTSTAVTPLWGKLSDLYGRKLIFQIAVVTFLVGSVLCGVAQSLLQLAVFRGIQGIGGGGLLSVPMIIVADILAPRERGRYMGYFTGVWAVAGVTGPMVGGFFVDHLSWRWIFYINIPLGIVSFVVIQLMLKLPFTPREHSIDYFGSTLLMGAISSLVLATSWAGPEEGWTAPLSVGLFGFAVAATMVFLWWERRAREPVVPLRLFRIDVMRVTCLQGFLSSAALVSATIYLPTFLQVVIGVSATNSGLRVAPMMVGVLISSVVTGRLTSRTGRYKHWFVGGAVVTLICQLAFLRLDTSISPWFVMGVMFVLGIGMGTSSPVLNLAAQNSVDIADIGTATSTLQFTRSVGQAIGVALSGAVLVSKLDAGLRGVAARNPLPEGMTARELASSPAAIARLGEPLHSEVVSVLADSISQIYWFTIPIAAIAVVNSLRLKEYPLKTGATVHRLETAPETIGDP